MASRRRYFVSLLAGVMVFSAGCCLGWSVPYLDQLPASRRLLDEAQTSWVTSSYCAGAAVGAPLGAYLVAKRGGKFALLAGAVMFMNCWILTIWSKSAVVSTIARIFGGAGSSLSILAVSRYIEDTSLDRCGDKMRHLMCSNVNLGVLFVLVASELLQQAVLAWMLLVVAVAFFMIFAWMPESPAFLIEQERHNEAMVSIGWLKELPPNSQAVLRMKDDLIPTGIGRRERCRARPRLKALIWCTIASTSFAAIGSHVVLMYMSHLFSVANAPSANRPPSSIIVVFFQTCAAYLSIGLRDRFGDKIVFVACSIAYCASVMALGTCFHVPFVPLVGITAALASSTMGIDPIVAGLCGRIDAEKTMKVFPVVIQSWTWLVTFVNVYFYFDIVGEIGVRYLFFGFALAAVICTIFVLLCFPELANAESSHEMQESRRQNAENDNRSEALNTFI